jgi:hypothetical protein
VILNAGTSLYGLSAYEERKDINRFKASARKTERHFESLSIEKDVQPNNAVFYIGWEQIQIFFLVETESDKMVRDFIRQDLLTGKSHDPKQYAMAAEYDYYGNHELDQALILINKAIAVNQNRADWDQLAKQQTEMEYLRRIEYFKSKLKQ